jgi:hypothetical protein
MDATGGMHKDAVSLLRRFAKRLMSLDDIPFTKAFQQIVQRISYNCIRGLAEQIVRRCEFN